LVVVDAVVASYQMKVVGCQGMELTDYFSTCIPRRQSLHLLTLPKQERLWLVSCFFDDVIAECMDMFKCLPVVDAISRCKSNFLSRFSQCSNFLCHLGCLAASVEFWLWTL